MAGDSVRTSGADSGHFDGYRARRGQAQLHAYFLVLVHLYGQPASVGKETLVFRLQTIFAGWEGGNREFPPSVADRAPLRAGLLAGQGNRCSRHAPAAGVRNHPSDDARDGLGVRGRDEKENGDR
jgi:hypothetical protein